MKAKIEITDYDLFILKKIQTYATDCMGQETQHGLDRLIKQIESTTSEFFMVSFKYYNDEVNPQTHTVIIPCKTSSKAIKKTVKQHGGNITIEKVEKIKVESNKKPRPDVSGSCESPADNTHGDLVPPVWLIEKLRKREGGCTMHELVAEAKD